MTVPCDVLVIGGGPAGALISLKLSEAGYCTVQVGRNGGNSRRPNEILSPQLLRTLSGHGLPIPPDIGTRCRGVLSLWHQESPDFHDYELIACSPGLSVSRFNFHQYLLESIKSKGVNIYDGALLKFRKNIYQKGVSIPIEHNGGTIIVNPEWIFDATGRIGLLDRQSKISRQYHDRLFAFHCDFIRNRYLDCLILEATADGWWYVPPSDDERTQLVFLTDFDLLPKNAEQRRNIILKSFIESLLLQDLAVEQPNFLDIKGTDARVSRLNHFELGRWVPVGDQAFSLDPLSGNGISTAINSAELVVSQYILGNKQESYSDWLEHTIKVENQFRLEAYSKAAHRFPGKVFWSRRTSLS